MKYQSLALRLAAAALAALALLLGPRAAGAGGVDWAAVEEEAVLILREYIRIDTANPPGDTVRAADFLARILESEGIRVTRFEPAPGKAIVLARLEGRGGGRPILLLHHMDVVPADESRWPVDPFAGVLEDGMVWGRGAVDMKGPGTAHLLAFLTLKRQDVPLARDVLFMAVPDEETGGEFGTRWMIENHYDRLDPEYVLDEGGFGTPDLFADGRLVYGISVAEKKVLWLRVRATGVAGHGSQPHDKNPNDRLVRALARLLGEPLPTGRNPLVENLARKVGGLADNKFTNAIGRSTIALTSLRSGVGDPPKVNVIPSVAEATLDCRLLPGTATDAWLDEVRRRLGDPGLEIEVVYESSESVTTPHDTPLFAALESAIRRHNPDAVVAPILIPYFTDGNNFRHRGARTYGLTPMALPEKIVGTMHSDGERLPVAELGEGVRILYEAIRETAGE